MCDPGFEDLRPTDDTPLHIALVCERGPDGKPRTNAPRLVVHHSPAGFEFGYGGSGPADLALNVCEWIARRRGLDLIGKPVKCHHGHASAVAWGVYQTAKAAIAALPEAGGQVPFVAFDVLITGYADTLRAESTHQPEHK